MNELKSFFKVADKIILEPLGKEVLGFTSDNAYNYFIAAKDTHKSYESLSVLLEGTTMEMCTMYLKELDDVPTAQGFLDWCSNNSNETFSLIYQLIFNFALSIYVQKVGVRLNNWNMIDAGRMKFLIFFYSFNHPIYQEVEYRDLKNRAMYPDILTQFFEKNSCFTKSKLDLNHQGGDFCLENKIKRHKMIAPKGITSNETWRTISRGLDEIEKVQVNTNKMLEDYEDEHYKDTDLYNEIVTWRALLRSSEMLNSKEEAGVIRNIFGEPLSFDLDNLTLKTEEKMEEYWSKAATGTPLQNIRYTPVLVMNRVRSLSHALVHARVDIRV